MLVQGYGNVLLARIGDNEWLCVSEKERERERERERESKREKAAVTDI